MGTNYYLEPDPAVCPTCKTDRSEELHIGKSSAGWVFLWRGYRDDGESSAGRDLTGPAEWFAFLEQHTQDGSHVIRDEYGSRHTLAEFRARVEAKRHPREDGYSARREDQPSPYRVTTVNHPEGDDVLFDEFS